ncbi:SGNH/GDSL hydrolase family protein [Actinokineospora spheciospongiae]|uniref:SGNH/GDSL hydrolase family protein n=1 Tax=Actinokineospora spheciospongiae TaxID=909613 RepID=UPI000D71C889|nr:SGNH/GDSL hydrolase family protein [Actinokineospora spheciospongiae]PWW65808.1 lysophospholipase L1-like esterase [Actinokineospora spheciospongiae]
MHGWTSWIAIGDSFTEGMGDVGADGSYVGWADRLAEAMALQRPGFQYANLAVRGKMLQEIVDEQVPLAAENAPDLVTICGGGNDLITPGTDVDDVAALFDGAVARLRAAGSEVLLFTGPDPKVQPLLRRIRGKVGIYNGHLHAIAERRGARVVDLWSMDVLHDRRAWCEDRLHFSSDGHRRIALRAAEVLGVRVDEDWREPLPTEVAKPWLRLRQDDLTWTTTHLLPWVARQIRGESLGDGLTPKRPDLQPYAVDRAAL